MAHMPHEAFHPHTFSIGKQLVLWSEVCVFAKQVLAEAVRINVLFDCSAGYVGISFNTESLK